MFIGAVVLILWVRSLVQVIEDVYDERFSYESQLQSAHQEEFLSECVFTFLSCGLSVTIGYAFYAS